MTVQRIMGIETEYGGEAWAAEGVRVGYLSQEPQLDPDKTVGENVMGAFAAVQAGASALKLFPAEAATPAVLERPELIADPRFDSNARRSAART